MQVFLASNILRLDIRFWSGSLGVPGPRRLFPWTNLCPDEGAGLVHLPTPVAENFFAWLIMAGCVCTVMQYFQAVQKGRQIAAASQMRLFNVAGFAMLTLTTKKVDGKFMPVGTEEYAAVIRTRDGFVAILADEDGYTKAQSKALDKNEAFEILDKLVLSGIPEFTGDYVEIWTEQYPRVPRD